MEATAEEVVNDPSYIEYFKQAEGSVKNSKGLHYVYDDQDTSYPKKFIQNAGEAKERSWVLCLYLSKARRLARYSSYGHDSYR